MKISLKFPFADEIRSALHAVPFEPFALCLHTGEKLKVRHPDWLSVTMSGRVIWDDGEHARSMNPTLIASIDAIKRTKRKA